MVVVVVVVAAAFNVVTDASIELRSGFGNNLTALS